MPDGLYRVTKRLPKVGWICAGFVVENGRVTMCADILRRRIGYWMTEAVRVSD